MNNVDNKIEFHPSIIHTESIALLIAFPLITLLSSVFFYISSPSIEIKNILFVGFLVGASLDVISILYLYINARINKVKIMGDRISFRNTTYKKRMKETLFSLSNLKKVHLSWKLISFGGFPGSLSQNLFKVSITEKDNRETIIDISNWNWGGIYGFMNYLANTYPNIEVTPKNVTKNRQNMSLY